MTIKKKFTNTFAPNIGNKELSVDQIILGLPHGLDFKKLPLEARQAVREEMARRHTKQYPVTIDGKEEILSLQDIKNRLLLYQIGPDNLSSAARKAMDEEARNVVKESLDVWWNTRHKEKYEKARRH